MPQRGGPELNRNWKLENRSARSRSSERSKESPPSKQKATTQILRLAQIGSDVVRFSTWGFGSSNFGFLRPWEHDRRDD